MPDPRPGILPDTEIARLLDTGAIAPRAERGQLQPASLDLALDAVAYRLKASFLPGPGRTVAESLDAVALHRIDLTAGGVLDAGGIYLVRLRERLDLPAGLRCRANPKSSTGRLDVFARVIADGCAAFDDLGEGYAGEVWVELSPRTFPIRVRPGSRLVQIRFSRGDTVLTAAEHAGLHDGEGPLSSGAGPCPRIAGVTLTLDLPRAGVAGWRARRHTGVVDVDLVDGHDPHEFWEPVAAGAHGLVLDPGEFYILASHETVRVPGGYAAEMAAFDAGIGEMRAHFAGFFDPGFGCGDAPSRAVLEVRTRDVPFLVRDRQAICRLVYERMAAPPGRAYGSGSNYQGQALRLGKVFSRPGAPRAEAA